MKKLFVIILTLAMMFIACSKRGTEPKPLPTITMGVVDEMSGACLRGEITHNEIDHLFVVYDTTFHSGDVICDAYGVKYELKIYGEE